MVDDWRTWLLSEDERDIQRLRDHTTTGRPIGSKAFLAHLTRLTGKPLTPHKRGRKPRHP